MATVTSTTPDFHLDSSWTVSSGSVTNQPTTVNAQKQLTISGIPSGSDITSAILTMQTGDPLTGGVLKVNGSAVSLDASVSVNLTVKGNGTVSVTFSFKAYGSGSMSDGRHTSIVSISNVLLTVTYQESTEPQPDPATYIESEKLVCLYDKHETDFKSNGICVLNPISCIVTEEEAGEYELELEHPMDEHGKWALIQEECVIRAPVPPMTIPSITIPATSVWRVKSGISASLYSKLPTYTKSKSGIDGIAANYTSYAWIPSKPYKAGEYCVTFGLGSTYDIHLAIADAPAGISPRGTHGDPYWTTVARDVPFGGTPDTGSGGTYDPGKIAETLSSEEMVTKTADYNADYMMVRSLRGVVGYIRRSDVELTEQSASGEVIPAREIKTQLFRIYSVESEEETETIIVRARHKSYDFGGNVLFDCILSEADPASAIAIMQGSLMWDDSRLIACNVQNVKVTADWGFQNPLVALLDPEEGLAGKLKAQVIRDNDDFFILSNANPKKGIVIKHGVNLTGVSWGRNIAEVITRIVPRASDGKDGYVYLDELFIDSQYAADYAVIRTEVLESEYSVGQEIERPDGTKVKLSREDVIDKMREEAQNRFTKDGCDVGEFELEVIFILLGDTEEFRQYRGLQRVNLYDKVTVITKAGLSVETQVTRYEWDCIRKRYNSIKTGRIFSVKNKSVFGWQIPDNSIPWTKLSAGSFGKVGKTGTANDLTTSDSGYALDARQGKELDEKKLDKASVKNNLTTADEGYALDARQGKLLNETKVTSTSTTISSNDSKTITLSDGFRGTIYVTGVNNSLFEMILIATSTSSAVRLKQAFSPSGLTVTTGTGTITIANGTANQARVDILEFDGTAT